MEAMKKISVIVAIILWFLTFSSNYGQVVTTIAGGYEGKFPLDEYNFTTRGFDVDQDGNIYIVALRRIVKIDHNTGLVSAVVGNGATPYDIYGDGRTALEVAIGFARKVRFDANNNLYFSSNDQIRVVDAQTGIVSTVAGTGERGYSGDGGPAVEAMFDFLYDFTIDPETGDIYIVDLNNYRVRKVDAQSGIISTVAGSGRRGFIGDGGLAVNAAFKDIRGIALYGTDLFLNDRGNSRIRKVDLVTGIISTYAGNGEKGYNGDGIPASEASLFQPEELEVAPDGNLLIADFRNHRVRLVERNTGLIQTIAGTGERGLGNKDIPATESKLSSPYGVTTDKSGSLYILDRSASRSNAFIRIQRINPDGIIDQQIFGEGKVVEKAYKATDIDVYPQAIAIDENENILIADQSALFKIDKQNNDYIKIAGTPDGVFPAPGLNVMEVRLSPDDIALDSQGDIYFTSRNSHYIFRIERESGIIRNYAGNGRQGYSGDGGPAQFAQVFFPEGLTFDEEDNLYFSDSGNNRIRRIDAKTGIITTIAGNGIKGFSGDGGLAVNARINEPSDIVLDSDGNLIFIDFYNWRIRKVDLKSGIIRTIAGFGLPDYSGDGGPAINAGMLPRSIAIDSRDNLYIGDGSRIRIVDAESGIIEVFAGKPSGGFSGDGGLAKDAEFGSFLVLEEKENKLFIGDINNYRLRLVEPLSTEMLDDPENLWVEGSFWTKKGTFRPTTWRQGRVQFSFDVNYIKKTSEPRGTARISFAKGPMYFRKDALISYKQIGELFILEGNGTVNNEGEFNFMIRYSRDRNTVRIIVNDALSGDLLYDNQYGDPLTAMPEVPVSPFDSWFMADGTPRSDINADLDLPQEELQLAFYPNPVGDRLSVQIPYLGTEDNVNLRVLSLTGELLFEHDVPTGYTSELNMTQFKEGVYILQMNSADNTEVRRIIKN